MEKEKQLAVEWLIEQLTEIHPKAFEQAKEMERSQKAEEYLTGFENGKNFKSK